ncbi:hypothetical protein GXN76_08510 [Kroppenstedtia pulmonis]|uniref:Tetratricopeptide repeat protein n=1 Tax=Kroppenstedtia pulmonis TaxID=1380685 RepID=A0A7D4BHF9_9BACL|nr:tetratricopeptide repeat protein [Kroppenstedtia pulmonis]QKG84515.1 hypothetical protein GXN76_08510 [Kroppenstedtia pulmonis]
MIGKLLKIVKSWLTPAPKMKLSSEKTPVQDTAVDEHNKNRHLKPDQMCEVAVTKDMDNKDEDIQDNTPPSDQKNLPESHHEKDTDNKDIQDNKPDITETKPTKPSDQENVPESDHVKGTDNKDEDIQDNTPDITETKPTKPSDQENVPESDHVKGTDNKDEDIQDNTPDITETTPTKPSDQENLPESHHEMDTHNKDEDIQDNKPDITETKPTKPSDQENVPESDHVKGTDNKDEDIQDNTPDKRETKPTKSSDQENVPESDHVKGTDNKDEDIQDNKPDITETKPTKPSDQENVPESEDFFHYQDEEFTFSIPWDKDEKEVFQQATEKYEETKKRLNNSAKKMDQHKIQRARYMQYWSLHLHYKDQAQYFYKKRDQEPDALEQAIRYCKKQVKYSPMARHALQMDPSFKGELPQHYGYKQLAIIYDKQGQYSDAIQLCRQALSEGWKGDWETRIQRYEKNLKS